FLRRLDPEEPRHRGRYETFSKTVRSPAYSVVRRNPGRNAGLVTRSASTYFTDGLAQREGIMLNGKPTQVKIVTGRDARSSPATSTEPFMPNRSRNRLAVAGAR